jgi:hypothetical protein
MAGSRDVAGARQSAQMSSGRKGNTIAVVQMRAGCLLGGLMALLAVMPGTVSGGNAVTPIPLRQPTGYRDYCNGYGKALQGQCATGGVPRTLWRPLRLPVVGSGGECPVSSLRTITTRVAPVLGDGPVYFSAGAYNAHDRTTMLVPDPASSAQPVAAGTGWSLAKSPLAMKATFRQPVIVRGRRIDGAGELGFSGDRGRRPYVAMQFAPRARAIPLGSYKVLSVVVWVSAPGCYAMQIDSTSRSQIVVFRVAFA